MLRMSGKNIIKDVGYIVKNLRNQRRWTSWFLECMRRCGKTS
jgi:hypothetical protein